MGRIPRLRKFLDFITSRKFFTWSGAVAVFVVAIVLVWFVPQWKTPDTTLNAQGNVVLLDDVARSQLENGLRETWAAITGGLIIFLGVIATFRRTSATERNVQVLQEGQITERFTRAIEQLGSDNTAICLGGIYALERIAKDSPENDHRQVMEVLTAYVRENARWEETDDEFDDDATPENQPSTVIQAILTVLGRRETKHENTNDRLNLSYTNLQNATFDDLSFEGADFSFAHMEGAHFIRTSLKGASFFGARLYKAWFIEAHLEKASFREAHLENAILINAQLDEADFTAAYLSRALLGGAILTGAVLIRAHLDGVSGLETEQISSSVWNQYTFFPEGFEPPPMRPD